MNTVTLVISVVQRTVRADQDPDFAVTSLS